MSAFMPAMQRFLDRLGEACPRFALSNKISLIDKKASYRNSSGRRLVSAGRRIQLELLAQNRGAGSLFDTALAYEGASFDEEGLLKQFKKEYDAFYTPADITPGRYPVVMNASDLFGTFLQHFVAEVYVSGASLLSGRLGQKAFSGRLSLRNDMNPETNTGVCFFDTEGCVAPDLRPALIEKGTLTGLLTTRKSAAQFHLQNLGTAAAEYDGAPSLGFNSFYPDPTAPSLGALVPGRAVYVVLASGGDTTPDGHFATPVQMAYLMENGELVGRLPELNVSGSFYDLLGKDDLGAVRSGLQPGTLQCAVTMDVKK